MFGGVAVVALVSGMIAGIMAIVGTRLWPIPAFVAAALTSLVIFYARHGRPVRTRPRTVWRRIGTVAAALIVTAAVALGGVVISYAILGLPLEDDDLALTCTARESLPRTAALSDGQRPTRTFVDSPTGFWHREEYDVLTVDDENLSEVQQVACLRRIGWGVQLNTCHYGDMPGVPAAYETSLYQGMWEVDVREARTGRTISTRQLAGETDGTCPSVAFIRNGDAPPDDHTYPSASDVLAALRTN